MFNPFLTPCSHFVSPEIIRKTMFSGVIKSELIAKYDDKLVWTCLDLCNRDLNRSCLVDMFSLRFSGSKFLIILQRQFCVRKIFFVYVKFIVHKFLLDFQSFHFVFKITISKMLNLCSRLLFDLLINRLLTSIFVQFNGIVFNRLNGLMIKFLIACLINEKN